MKTISRYIMTLALLLTAVTGAWAADTYTITFSGFGNENCNKTVTDATLEYSETFNVTDVDANYISFNGVGGSNDYVSISESATQFTITVKSAFEGTVNVTVDYVNGDGDESQSVISVTCVKSAPSGPDVIIADGNGEASFKMPQYDVTATYTIKRDMTVDMDVTVQDAQQNSRFRVQKQDNSFVPVGLTNEQVMALFKVHDDIESKDLTAITDYTVQIFAADDNDQPTGTAMTFSNFTYAPGKYVVKAVAAEGSNYSGETALSNVFTLFQGYEVTVPAGEYITYYKDEALYVEDTDAKLYTITAVNGDKATATELTVAAANTPLLVKNNAETEKTILLIPTTTDTPDNVTPYEGFKGTLEATQIAASTATQNNYAFNGKEFVWVKDALNIAANKAWLEVNTPSNARAISIVFGDTTGISEALRVKSEDSADGDWYDLDGRKLQAAPKRKGVYIHNGRKEVVK